MKARHYGTLFYGHTDGRYIRNLFILMERGFMIIIFN